MFLIAQTASNVRRAANSAALLALAASSGCSSERAIAHSSNQIVSTAQSSRGRFVWIADEAGKQSPNLPGIRLSAIDGVSEQESIIQSAATIIYNLPGVRDVTPVWAEIIVWALIAISAIGVIVILMQTGIPRLISSWIARFMPRKANADA